MPIQSAGVFVFYPGGRDRIMDFEPGKDRIAIAGYSGAGFTALSSHFSDTPEGVLITFGPGSGLQIAGLATSQLGRDDFVLI